ncbi:thioredoxin [Candidatus Babeliales bacterium]|nr:thioredoxin [Candidatus Babeliales bacterium]
MTVIINSENFEKEIKESTLPIVIDIFATWCGPCQQVGPIFEELAKELSNKYKFAKLNIDEERDLAIQYSVSSVPTFIFIKKGKVVGREQGYMDKETLKSKIESYFG